MGTRRVVLVCVLAACGSRDDAPSGSEAPTAQPAVEAAAPVAPRETSVLVGAAALAHLPADVHGVVVIDSLARVERELLGTSAAPALEMLTGLSIEGLAPDRLAGIAALDPAHARWILFGHVADAQALRSSVPADRLAIRDGLAFVASSPGALKKLGPGKEASLSATIDPAAKRLPLGALLSWWRADRGVAGVAVAGDQLWLAGLITRGAEEYARVQAARPGGFERVATSDPRAGPIGSLTGAGSDELQERRDAAERDIHEHRRALAEVRRAAREAVAAALADVAYAGEGAEPTRWAAPAGTVVAWSRGVLETWLTGEREHRAAIDAAFEELEQVRADGQKARRAAAGDEAVRKIDELLWPEGGLGAEPGDGWSDLGLREGPSPGIDGNIVDVDPDRRKRPARD